MSQTPEELAEAAGSGGEGGNSPPTDDAEALRAELSRVKSENATLREERRSSRAKELGHEHSLDDATVDLISRLPVDQQAEHAAKIAEARKASAPQQTPPPVGEGTTPAAGTGDEPANAAALQSMRNQGGDGAQEMTPQSLKEQMDAEINGAQSFKEIEAIQEKYTRLAQERGDPSLLAL